MRTLKDILTGSCVWDKLTITIFEHKIEVESDKPGSWFIIRNFYDEKFTVEYFDECSKHLYITAA